MTFVPQSSVLPRCLWRPAMLFFAVAQIALAFAPLADARVSGDASAHVEEAGVELHHAHNDAGCAACTARELLSSSRPVDKSAQDYIVVAHARSAAGTIAFVARPQSSSRSRAPPS